MPFPDRKHRARAWLAAAGITEAERWLPLAGGAPFLAAELGSGEHGLLDTLLAELAKGVRIDPLAAAAAADKAVKASVHPAPLKRLVEWAQKWFIDLALLRVGQGPRYFLTQAAPLAELSRRAELPDLLALNRKALQYRMYCEQPLNSRLFLEDFFLGYAALFKPVQNAHG